MAINAIPSLAPLPSLQFTNPVSASGQTQEVVSGNAGANGAAKVGADFSQFLAGALQQVNTIQQQGEAASAALTTGQVQDVHTVMLAVEKASLSLGLTVQVRNKVLDAYHEVMRMQI